MKKSISEVGRWSASVRGLLIALMLSLGVAAPVMAESTLDKDVVTIVRVPKPWYAPKALIVYKMGDTVSEYEKLPGLAYKVYTIGQTDGHFGGVYLWKDRASAKAWFNPAWFARVEKERGAPGEVRYFDVLNVVDHTPGGTPAATYSDAVLAVVTLPTPAGADRKALARTLRALMDSDMPGLLREYTLVGSDGRIGAVFLWRDNVTGEKWMNDEWQANLRRTFAADPVVEWYDAPILSPSTLAATR